MVQWFIGSEEVVQRWCRGVDEEVQRKAEVVQVQVHWCIGAVV